jgi:ABC-2 type transport system permease protein
MSKFKTIFLKELKELITIQTVLPLIIVVIIFSFIGDIVGSEREKSEQGTSRIGLIDMDNSDESKKTIKMLKDMNVTVVEYDTLYIDNAEKYETDNVKTIIKIPTGFGEKIKNLEPVDIDKYSVLKGISMFSAGGDNYINNVLGRAGNTFADEYIKNEGIDKDPEKLRSLIRTKNNIIMNKKMANVSPGELFGFVMSQSLFVPIIIFMLMIMGIQMIITSIVSEKENKTLETLLSCPINRVSIVTTKILAAGILSLVFAIVYMIGMSGYLNGITGGELSGANIPDNVSNAIKTLGFSMSTGDYVLLGISLFLSIITGLAAALILGTFVDDIKKAQGIIAPMMVMLLIPYLLSMFIDINNASMAIKVIVYIIPFSHSFMASKNLMFNNNMIVLIGILYQFIVFVILIIIAARIFSTDRILTNKLSFKLKKSVKAY